MSTREANGLVGAAVRGEEADGAANALLPISIWDFGFGIADWMKFAELTELNPEEPSRCRSRF